MPLNLDHFRIAAWARCRRIEKFEQPSSVFSFFANCYLPRSIALCMRFHEAKSSPHIVRPVLSFDERRKRCRRMNFNARIIFSRAALTRWTPKMKISYQNLIWEKTIKKVVPSIRKLSDYFIVLLIPFKYASEQWKRDKDVEDDNIPICYIYRVWICSEKYCTASRAANIWRCSWDIDLRIHATLSIESERHKKASAWMLVNVCTGI